MSEDSRTLGLAIDHVGKLFPQSGKPDFRALDDVSLIIRPNEFFTLLGPSGCGKTTLLRMLAGFEHPTEGDIRLDGASISDLPPNKRPINTVFQNYALFPHLSVAANITFGLEMLGKPRAEIDATLAAMLKLVRMEDMADRKTSQISGGQQQRVALARALAPRPKVLLLDEPLSALDLKLRKDMQIELKRMQSETGITFVFVTHDQEEALTMSDRIAVMNAGKVLQVGSPRDIYDRPANHFVANFIGESNFLTGSMLGTQGNRATISLSNGAAIEALIPDAAALHATVTVVVRPEHAMIGKAGDGQIEGKIETLVYFGTDTHFHIRVADGTEFTVRQQNRRGDEMRLKQGDAVSIRLPPGVATILTGVQ